MQIVPCQISAVRKMGHLSASEIQPVTGTAMTAAALAKTTVRKMASALLILSLAANVYVLPLLRFPPPPPLPTAPHRGPPQPAAPPRLPKRTHSTNQTTPNATVVYTRNSTTMKTKNDTASAGDAS